jgi:putative acetyltransferase
MKHSYSIRLETPDDFETVHAINYAAFDNDPEMPILVQDLRRQTEGFVTQSIVAVGPDDIAVGHVMISHAWLDADKNLVDVMVLSPLAVHHDYQSQGIGTALISASIKAADQAGSPLLFLEGPHLFYGSRGFENAENLGFRRPSLRIPPKAFQVAKLSGYNDSMTGTLVYKNVHWRGGVGLYR